MGTGRWRLCQNTWHTSWAIGAQVCILARKSRRAVARRVALISATAGKTFPKKMQSRLACGEISWFDEKTWEGNSVTGGTWIRVLWRRWPGPWEALGAPYSMLSWALGSLCACVSPHRPLSVARLTTLSPSLILSSRPAHQPQPGPLYPPHEACTQEISSRVWFEIPFVYQGLFNHLSILGRTQSPLPPTLQQFHLSSCHAHWGIQWEFQS